MTKRSSPKQYRLAPERKVVHLTPDGDALAAFGKGDAGAERLVLERLADSVVSGGTVHPDIQKIANAIIAKALLEGRGTLPEKKAGRPKGDAFKGHQIAYRFYELEDAGMGYGDALAVVSEEFHRSERQVERLITKYRPTVGFEAEDRERHRLWRQACEETGFEDYEAVVRIHLNHLDGLSGVNTASSSKRSIDDARRVLEGLRSEVLAWT